MFMGATYGQLFSVHAKGVSKAYPITIRLFMMMTTRSKPNGATYGLPLALWRTLFTTSSCLQIPRGLYPHSLINSTFR